MDENKKSYSFRLMVKAQGTIVDHWITTDVNLLENYKNAMILGSGHIAWEKGALDTKHIVGIFDEII